MARAADSARIMAEAEVFGKAFATDFRAFTTVSERPDAGARAVHAFRSLQEEYDG